MRIVEVGNDLLVLARGLVVLKLELLRGATVLSGLAGAALLGAAVAFAFIGVAARVVVCVDLVSIHAIKARVGTTYTLRLVWVRTESIRYVHSAHMRDSTCKLSTWHACTCRYM